MYRSLTWKFVTSTRTPKRSISLQVPGDWLKSNSDFISWSWVENKLRIVLDFLESNGNSGRWKRTVASDWSPCPAKKLNVRIFQETCHMFKFQSHVIYLKTIIRTGLLCFVNSTSSGYVNPTLFARNTHCFSSSRYKSVVEQDEEYFECLNWLIVSVGHCVLTCFVKTRFKFSLFLNPQNHAMNYFCLLGLTILWFRIMHDNICLIYQYRIFNSVAFTYSLNSTNSWTDVIK